MTKEVKQDVVHNMDPYSEVPASFDTKTGSHGKDWSQVSTPPANDAKKKGKS